MEIVYPTLGLEGIRSDLAAGMLPKGAWTGALNVRVRDGQVQRTQGYLSVLGTPQVTPYAVAAEQDTNGIWHWVYLGAADVWAVVSGAHTKITRASGIYTGSANVRWNTCRLGRVPIYNNGVDVPQYWATVSSAQPLQDLVNWPATVRAQVIRPYKAYLVALHITDSGDTNQNELRWSHPAAPGTVPVSWDYTDPTKSAGRVDIGDGSTGGLVDCLPLRGENILYKDDSVHSMRLVGGQNIFAFDTLFEGVSCLGRDCVVPVPGPQGALHFVLGRHDIIIHDAVTSPVSVLERRLREWYTQSLNRSYAHRSFCLLDVLNREAWACIPTGTSEWPDMAITWSWDTGACMLRELPALAARSSGLLQVAADGDWDADAGTWDSDATPWDVSPFWNATTGTWDEQISTWNLYGAPTTIPRVVAASPDNNKLYVLDYGETADGAAFTSYVERLALPLTDTPAESLPYRALCSRLWAFGTGQITVTVGGYRSSDGVPTWKPGVVLDFSQERQVPVEVAGAHLSLRMGTTGTQPWSCANLTLEVSVLGQF